MALAHEFTMPKEIVLQILKDWEQAGSRQMPFLNRTSADVDNDPEVVFERAFCVAIVAGGVVRTGGVV